MRERRRVRRERVVGLRRMVAYWDAGMFPVRRYEFLAMALAWFQLLTESGGRALRRLSVS